MRESSELRNTPFDVLRELWAKVLILRLAKNFILSRLFAYDVLSISTKMLPSFNFFTVCGISIPDIVFSMTNGLSFASGFSSRDSSTIKREKRKKYHCRNLYRSTNAWMILIKP